MRIPISTCGPGRGFCYSASRAVTGNAGPSPLPSGFRGALPSALLGVLLAGIAIPGGLVAQSGGDVLRTALDRYQERMEGIENYTVVQEAMGFQSTTYFERTEVDGRPVFLPQSETGSAAAQGTPDNPYSEFYALADRAEREGTEMLEGEETHVIAVTDFEGVDLWNPTGGGEPGDFTPRRATFFIDTDDYLLRRMQMTGTTSMQGQEREVSFTADFQDYREVDGLLHPFGIQVSVEGLASQMSPEEREELERSLQEMRAQLEEMPAQQREMVERMMSGQLEQMETMLAQGTMDLTVQVTEVRVNEGPPQGAQ